jgi:hypothetical protein
MPAAIQAGVGKSHSFPWVLQTHKAASRHPIHKQPQLAYPDPARWLTHSGTLLHTHDSMNFHSLFGGVSQPSLGQCPCSGA